MQLRRSHSAIIKSPHTYVSARVAYDGLEEVRQKRLTHLFSPHPLMIKHPLDIGSRCKLVWKSKKINRGPFPLDSDLSLHQQTRYLHCTDISEIPLAQPWPLKSKAYKISSKLPTPRNLRPIHIPVFYQSSTLLLAHNLHLG